MGHFLVEFRIAKRILCPPGTCIAIVGTDGSGKSTVIEGIRPVMEEALHSKMIVTHMRPNLLPSLARLFGREVQKGPVTNPHASRPSGFLGSLLRLAYYSLDYIIGYWTKVRIAIARRPCLWVFDRYFYDYLIDPMRSRISLPHWLVKAWSFIIPRPDLILCLGTDPEVIHKRKPEISLDEVRRQTALLKEFCNGNPRAVWIDTGCSIDESVNRALDVITDRMARRYPEFYHAQSTERSA